MAINIDSFRKFILFTANKSGKGGLPSPSEFDMIVNRGLMEWTMKRFDNRKEYQPGRPIPPISYEKTLAVMDDLRHLKEDRMFLVGSDGRLNIPDGSSVTDMNGNVAPAYLHLSVVTGHYTTMQNGVFDVSEVPIEVVSDEEFARRMDSTITRPNLRYPILNIKSTYFDIRPKTFQYAQVIYLRIPATATWAYNTVNERPVYDASNSVDIDAPEEAFNEIAMNVLSFMGINMREDELIQYAELNKRSGV